MRPFALFFSLFLLAPEAEAKSSLAVACQQLVKNDKTLLPKCVSHGEFFELNSEFVSACTKFHDDVEIRMRCLKSGANMEILKLCQSAGWSLDGTLTCLRAYPTSDGMKACKALSEMEEEQIRCVRMGREKAQVDSCVALAASAEERLHCLQMDIPYFEANRCSKNYKDNTNRFHCLENYVAQRENEFRRDQAEVRGRVLASEPQRSEKPKTKIK